jgi:glucose/arabinose dehydrogenase
MECVGNHLRPFRLVLTVLLLVAETPMVARAVQSGEGALQAQPGAPPTQGARGGGRPNLLKPSADVYQAACAGCHGGADGSVGRAPALLDEKVLDTLSDADITRIVRHGVPNSDMMAFGPQAVSDDQLFNLVFYLRSQAAVTRTKVQVVVDPDGAVIQSEKQKFKIEVLSRGLTTPWGMAFLPGGRLLITERPGRIRIYDNGKLSEPLKNTPAARVQQDGGYLDISVDPNYAGNGWIYLAYSEVQPGWTPPPPGSAPPAADSAGPRYNQGPPIPANTVIVRGRISKDNEWTDQQILFRSPEKLYSTRGEHYGCRFAWDKQGHLFFTLGERGNMANAQDLSGMNSLGKIHRINADGSVPKDNPFVGKPDTDPTIWSYGHRNPQGLAFDPVTGDLWESEHGPIGGDEINLIKPGHNYGWGVVTMGIQPGITEHEHAGMDQPIVYYNPSFAPAGITFYTGNKYPAWKNTSLFVGFLVGQQLRRLEISGDKVTHQEVLFSQYGRVRDIIQGPDGYLYILLQEPTGVNGISLSADTPGRLIRLMPVS